MTDFWKVAACIIAGVLAVTMFLEILAGRSPKPVDYMPVCVQNGDTLWKLAQESDGYGRLDTRDIIADMKWDGETLHRGDIVYVPMYYTETEAGK